MKYIVIICLLIFTKSISAQVVFTNKELLILAEHNVERIYLKDLSNIQQTELDSLNRKIELLNNSFELCQENEKTFNEIITKLNSVIQKKEDQTNILETELNQQKETILKSEKKIKRWRIATPILIIGAFITAIFIQ